MILIMLFSSCKKDIGLDRDEIKGLFGEWEWIQTTGGLAGINATSLTTRDKEKIEFTKAGYYKKFVNDELVQKLRYHVTDNEPAVLHGLLIEFKNTVFDRKNNLINQTFKISSDTLELREDVMDGFSYYYVRIR